jgi:hypothetical protein
MEEIWKPVVGYEGLYDVSNMGRVRSYFISDCLLKGKRGFHTKTKKCPQRVLSNRMTSYGYHSVRLSKKGIAPVNRNVHSLVLNAFVGPCPTKYECCHKNNIKTDNRVENLCWGTHLHNSKDYGTQAFGEKSGRHKLTYSNVVAIRNMRNSGYTQREIGDFFGVHNSVICLIFQNKIWNHPDLERTKE